MSSKRETYRITAKDDVTQKITSIKIPIYVIDFYAQKIYVQIHGRKFETARKMSKQRAKQILVNIMVNDTWSDKSDLISTMMLQECL